MRRMLRVVWHGHANVHALQNDGGEQRRQLLGNQYEDAGLQYASVRTPRLPQRL